MRTRACLLFVAACAVPVSAQSVTTSVAAATPLSTSVAIGSINQSQSLPTGPLPESGALTSMLGPAVGNANATISWQQFSFASQLIFRHVVTGLASAPQAASASIPTHEILLTLTAATPRDVAMDVSFQLLVAPGAPAPFTEIDLGDDGLYEFSSGGLNALVPMATVGPQGYRIRIRSQGMVTNAAGPANFSLQATIVVRPDNQVAVNQNVFGCDSTPLLVRPTFASTGVEITPGSWLTAVVSGLGQQPILLPSPVSSCLLLPSPDILLFGNPSYEIPIPASARPITFFVQGVTLFSLPALQTTDGYEVSAF